MIFFDVKSVVCDVGYRSEKGRQAVKTVSFSESSEYQA